MMPKKQEAKAVTVQPPRPKPSKDTVLLPSFEKVKGDKVLYAHVAYSAPRRKLTQAARMIQSLATAIC